MAKYQAIEAAKIFEELHTLAHVFIRYHSEDRKQSFKEYLLELEPKNGEMLYSIFESLYAN